MPTKVLALTQIYPSQRAPLRGPYNHSILKGISRHCDVRVVVPIPCWRRIRHPTELWKATRENHTGLAAILPTFWSVPKLTALHGNGMYYSLRSCVAQVRRDFPFDVILAVWAYPDAFAAAKLAREYNCPLVINVLGSDVNELTKNPRLCRQIVQSMQTAYCTIAVSVALRDRLLDLGIPPNRTVVQHNGVDGERFTLCDRRTARAQLGLPLDVPTICYIGRLGQEKGVDILLRAMHDLKTSGRGDIELNLVGWGECEAALRLQVSRMQLENQVHFRGPRPHHEVPQWISAGDLLCLPSRREGCPNVILEALASGRPVVAARVGGVPELIDAHNGVLVPPEDPTALAAGLVYALQRAWNPEELRATVEFLSWDAVGERYYARLVEALKAQPSPGSSAVRDTDKRA